jgi:hypothetical protein
MAQLISVEQAAQTALKTWIASQLSGVTIFDHWPDMQDLPARAISILRAGTREDEFVDIVCIAEPTPGTYTWRLRACEQPLQLDVWTTSDPARSDIMARLEAILNAGPSFTLNAVSFPDVPTDPFTAGILLQLPGAWSNTLADFTFDEPRVVDSPTSIKEREYRATYRGRAYFDLTLSTTSPRMTRIDWKSYLNGAATAQIATITDSAVTYSQGT